MNILDRIDPHLTSEDTAIREFALYTIRSFPSFKPEWPERLIRAALEDQANTVSYLVPLENRTLGENELELLLEALHKTKLNYPHLFMNVLNALPLAVKIAHRNQIGTLISREDWTFLMKVSEADKDELGAMLQILLEKLESTAYDHRLYSRAKQIAHQQVSQGYEYAAELCRVLGNPPEDQGIDFNAIITVYKLGLLKDAASIPVLASLFSHPEDLLQEELADALASFQSDEVVRAVEIYARSEDPIFPITTIAKTHSQLAVATLKQLYADVDVSDSQSFIIQGLAEQLAADGRPEIEDFMSQKWRPQVFDNEEMAYGYFKVMEFEHPQLELWGQNARDRHERQLKARDEPLDAALKRFMESKQTKQQAVSDKVGRNDPCPCGSGKKYKKCHG